MRRIILFVLKGSIACSLLKKRIATRKRRADSLFVGDLIYYAGHWFEVQRDIGEGVIVCRCYMTGGKEIMNVGDIMWLSIKAKVIVLKNKYPLWKRCWYRIVK